MSSSDSYESLQLLWLQALLEVHLDSIPMDHVVERDLFITV